MIVIPILAICIALIIYAVTWIYIDFERQWTDRFWRQCCREGAAKREKRRATSARLSVSQVAAMYEQKHWELCAKLFWGEVDREYMKPVSPEWQGPTFDHRIDAVRFYLQNTVKEHATAAHLSAIEDIAQLRARRC